MLKKDTIITLDNDAEYTVLRTMKYNDNEFALITDFKGDDNVVKVENDNGEVVISLISDEKEEELIVNKFLKESLEELKTYQE